MASHVQTQRRQFDRAPGILHPVAPGSAPPRPVVMRSASDRRQLLWRAASASLLLALGGLLAMFFASDVFFVRSLTVRGNDLVPREEIFAWTDAANYHMLWLDPVEIRAKLLRSPSIADAAVSLGWPPNLVTIVVEERQPALVWSDSGAETWIDLQGRAMPARAEMPNAPRVNLISGDYGGLAPAPQDFTAETTLGALRLIERLPQGASLDFHPAHGLGWTNEQGWRVWMGRPSAMEMSEKLRMYEALAANLNSRAIDIAELNIARLDAPFYRVLWGQ